MLGTADNANTLGVIPCAISWLFRGINEQKQKTGARFSVRVSAVEVCGPSNQLKDLLAGHANGKHTQNATTRYNTFRFRSQYKLLKIYDQKLQKKIPTIYCEGFIVHLFMIQLHFSLGGVQSFPLNKSVITFVRYVPSEMQCGSHDYSEQI